MITPDALHGAPGTAWPLSSTLPPMGALVTAPATARAHVRAVLAGWRLGDLADACELVASELVANAVRASARGRWARALGAAVRAGSPSRGATAG